MSDDFEDETMDMGESGFDEFEKKQTTLGDLWRNNPMVKIGVIAGGGILVVVAIFLFSGKAERPDLSFVPAGSEVKAPPGTEESSPAYVAAVQEENETRIEQAVKEGGSALPTPIEPPVGRFEVTDQQPEAEDPLQRWRKLQEERLQREMQRTQTSEEAPDMGDSNRGAAIQALSDLMAEQMQAVLETKSVPVSMQSLSITSPSFLEQLRAQEQAALAAAGNQGQLSQEILLPAGQIAYAQLLTEANSDVPGPVLAQIVSGPLNGNRILGSFQVQEELLTLTFNTVVIDGVSQGIDAIALDPKTTLPAMATDVDHRYFKRILLPMAAAFVEGAAQAIAESGLTTITISGDTVASETEESSQDQEVASGVEEAGQELREILEETADDTEVLVRIEAGTPMGILFIQPVLKPVPGQPFQTPVSPTAQEQEQQYPGQFLGQYPGQFFAPGLFVPAGPGANGTTSPFTAPAMAPATTEAGN